MPPYRDTRSGRWRYRKIVRLPNGKRMEIRGTPLTNTRLAAQRMEQLDIARVLGANAVMPQAPAPSARKERVPTLKEFSEEFMETYVRANNKPSERISKEYMFRCHLLPAFGKKRLDEIATRDVERFKADKLDAGYAPKSVNNFLTCLGRTLRYAAENEVIEKIPRIKFVRVFQPKIDFLDFDEYVRLVEAAKREPEALAAILLGGDAGLRMGEIRALKWEDIDLVAARLTVQRTDYRGYLGSPKGGRIRTVPFTRRLTAALKAVRHLRGPFVFCTLRGTIWSRGMIDSPLRRAWNNAKLRKIGWHSLRHTFCSHLAMKGAPVRTIQELAGHASITTTMRYMHLTPSAARDAIALLESPTSSQHCLNTTDSAEKLT